MNKSAYKAKICGTTNLEDAGIAADFGADYFGVVVEVDFSPRSLLIEQAKDLFSSPPIPGVALVFEMEHDRVELMIQTLNPFAVQFLHQADPGFIIKLKKAYPNVELWQSIHLPQAGEDIDFSKFKNAVDTYIRAGIDSILFDTAALSKGKMKFGGTGITSDWKIIKDLMQSIDSPVPMWLAGGINPENVGEALDFLNPYGIDLCSGVEAVPGKKDPLKVKKLMSIIKQRSSIQDISDRR